MRPRATFFILFFAVSLLTIPLFAHANSIPFFGPIVPPASISGVPNSDICPAGWGMLIVVINNIILLLLTLAIVFVAPIMIAWSGFLFVVNPVNASGKEQAKKILLNTVVGIVIALAGWMIVDALMAVLYNPSATYSGGVLGKWSDIITSGGAAQCLDQKGALPGAVPTAGPGVTTGAGGGTQVGTAKGPCSSDNKACSTSALQQGANALNMSLTDAQLTSMSCIAMTESTGNPYTPDSNTGACGTFQITNRPGNWGNAAFHKGTCSTSSPCNDPSCNMQTALIMFSKQGYQPWTGKNPDGTYWNANAVACVQQYDAIAGLRL